MQATARYWNAAMRKTFFIVCALPAVATAIDCCAFPYYRMYFTVDLAYVSQKNAGIWVLVHAGWFLFCGSYLRTNGFADPPVAVAWCYAACGNRTFSAALTYTSCKHAISTPTRHCACPRGGPFCCSVQAHGEVFRKSDHCKLLQAYTCTGLRHDMPCLLAALPAHCPPCLLAAPHWRSTLRCHASAAKATTMAFVAVLRYFGRFSAQPVWLRALPDAGY
jgi:hypothetical protein